jgi:hypothetical protein
MNRLVSRSPLFILWFLGSSAYFCFAYISEKDTPWWLLLFGVIALGMDWRARMEAGFQISNR